MNSNSNTGAKQKCVGRVINKDHVTPFVQSPLLGKLFNYEVLLNEGFSQKMDAKQFEYFVFPNDGTEPKNQQDLPKLTKSIFARLCMRFYSWKNSANKKPMEIHYMESFVVKQACHYIFLNEQHRLLLKADIKNRSLIQSIFSRGKPLLKSLSLARNNLALGEASFDPMLLCKVIELLEVYLLLNQYELLSNKTKEEH